MDNLTLTQKRNLHLLQLIKEYDLDLKLLTRKITKKKQELLKMWYEWYNMKQELKNTTNIEKKKILEKHFLTATKQLNTYEKKIGLMDNEIRQMSKRKCKFENKLQKKLYTKIEEPKPLLAYDIACYSTPEIFQNQHTNKTALIISSGPSTQNLIKYKDKLREKFDVIIGINGAVLCFEDIMDFHVIIDRVYRQNLIDSRWFEFGKYIPTIPRILNWKSIHVYPADLNIIKITRCDFYNAPNIRQYKHNGQEGLLVGPKNRQGLSVGTPVTQSIHFAGILGCSKVYLIGAELKFDKQYDHFYKDRLYRDNLFNTKTLNTSMIVKVTHDNELIETTEYFLDSAEYMNEVLIPKICTVSKLKVFDFSGGLLSKNIQLNLDTFMNK